VVNIATSLEGIPSVWADNYTGVRDAVHHLVEVHGYRRIALLRGAVHPETEERYRAYTDVLAEHGILDPNLVTPPSDQQRLDGMAAIDLLLDERRVSFEAVVASNDAMAFGAMDALRARGIRVPDEVAVVGFDDSEQARATTPPLTTVRQPMAEMGKQAVEMLLALLAGEKVPKQVALTPELVVRQSCGCTDPAIAQAAVEPVTRSLAGAATGETFEVTLTTRRKDILSDMVQAVGTPAMGLGSGWAEQLLDAFAAELGEGAPGAFVSTLDEVLRQVVATEDNVGAWQGALSALRRHALPYLGDDKALSRAENLWQQARVIIGGMAERERTCQRLQAQQRAETLRQVSQSLTTTADMAELMDILARELPRLGIPSCYLSLYEDPESPAEWSRLLLAYDEDGRVELEAGGQRFSSLELAPGGMFRRENRYSMILEPLYSGENQLGFVLFEASPQEAEARELLRAQLSSALQKTLLVQQMEEQSRALQEASYALQRRTTQLEASAKVGQAITSAVEVDQLLRQTADLICDRFGFYHVGIFLLDETGEWLVLQEATGEAGAQMKAQGHRLAMGETSLVGWTALHRQPRIALDIGGDAVRLSPPLLPYTRSEITLPLMAGDHLLGVLNIQSTEQDAFGEDDMRVLQGMADQVAVAIESAQLFQETQRALGEMEILYRASQTIGTATSVEETGQALIDHAATSGVDAARILLFEQNEQGQPTYIVAREGWTVDNRPTQPYGTRLPLENYPLADLMDPNEPIILEDVLTDPRGNEATRTLIANVSGLRSCVLVPIAVEEHWFGMIFVGRNEPSTFADEFIRGHWTLAGQAAIALERLRLFETTQRRVAHERLLSDITARMRETLDMDLVLQTAIREIGDALDIAKVEVRMRNETGTE
jgi:GAF domain-containing protein